MPTDPTAFWEARYADAARIWSGRVNRVLADVASELAPGTALDLGCGEGGDAVWLAQQGWRVTGVDLSSTAIARARAAARDVGVPGDALELHAADLATWTTEARFDLVSASFLQAPVEVEFPRARVLRTAAGLVAPGGRLLVVAHAAPPSWVSREQLRHLEFPTAAGDLAALDLDPDAWRVLVCEHRDREAVGPDGAPAHLVDTVVLVQRVG